MEITDLVAHLRQQCPAFEKRVGGGVDIDALLNEAKLALPCAFVVFAGDDPEPNDLESGVSQEITDEWHVIAAVHTVGRGQEAVLGGLQARSDLLRALVGWKPDARHTPLQYGGCLLLRSDAARSFYQFVFTTAWVLGGASFDPKIDVPETWLEAELVDLPQFESLQLNVDFQNSSHGPDAQIEHRLEIKLR